MKTIFDAMKENVAKYLSDIPHELLAVSSGESIDKETGNAVPFQRYEAEVPKGFDEFSRCRFTVKVMNGKILVTEKELKENEYTIVFGGLEVSYVSEKGVVFFRATEVKIQKEGT